MKNLSQKPLRGFAALALLLIACIGAVYALASTVKPVREWLHDVTKNTVLIKILPYDDDENDHDSAAEMSQKADSAFQEQAVEISFSPSAAKNSGIDDSTIATVEVVDFNKSFTFPGIVVERSGFSTITVPSSVSGIVTKIYHESGVAVAPGEPLFDILLNQQELVKAQTEFLNLLKRREINAAELQRLNAIDPELVPKQHRDLVYEKMQLEQNIGLQKNVLRLQGLSENDILESLEKKGRIIQNMTVYAPSIAKEENIASSSHADEEEHVYTIDELYVTTGKNVSVGDSLCQLSDYCKLAIRGKVFAADEKALAQALFSKSRVTAVFEGNGSREIADGLFIRSIDNKIDMAGGTLFCYVDLKNRFNDYEVNGESKRRRYIQWHFKPGRRCELNVEYEPLKNCIVLPVDAVAKDLQEMCVFEWVGNEDDKKIWRKRPVHVIYQTKDVVVIANDGSVFPGAKVATKGASFLLAALDASNQKNAGGGGIQHGDHVH